MNKVFDEFKDKSVVFYQVYTREPHPGQDHSKKKKDPRYDFSNKKQTKTEAEREAYALQMIQDFSQKLPILIDTFGKDCVQNWRGGRAPNSLAVIDRDGKLALWQTWTDPSELTAKLTEMTESKSQT